MMCPYCRHGESYVTRGNATDASRMRRCLDCGREFRTIEILDDKYPGYVLKLHLDRILERSGGGGQ